MNLGELSTKEVYCVGPEDPLDRAFKIMEGHGVRHLPVVAHDELVGMVSDRDLLLVGVGRDADTQNEAPQGAANLPRVAQIMSQPVLTLSPDDPLRSATWLMVKHRVHAIPLVRGKRLAGLVTETDLLRGVLDSQAVLQLNGELFFRQPVISQIRGNLTTVGPKTSLHDVVDIMCGKKIRHLPVVVDELLLGIVSDRDVLKAFGRAAVMDAQSQELGQFYLGPMEVREVMSQTVNTIPSSLTTQTAIEELLRFKIHCLPVVDNGKLLGIITDTDLLRAIGTIDKKGSLQALSE